LWKTTRLIIKVIKLDKHIDWVTLLITVLGTVMRDGRLELTAREIRKNLTSES